MQRYYSFQKLSWMIHFHQVNLKYVDLVCLIDVIEIQWVDFYFILEMRFQPNFRNMILELILKIGQLKLIYEKESGFSIVLIICIYGNFIFMGDLNIAMGSLIRKLKV